MGNLTDLRSQLMENPAFRAGYEQQGQLVRFGQIMRGARESQCLTQAQLAGRLKISQLEIRRLEKGEGINGPTFERLVAFAHALGFRFVVGFAADAPVDTPRAVRAEILPARAFGGFALRKRTVGTTTHHAAVTSGALWGAF